MADQSTVFRLDLKAVGAGPPADVRLRRLLKAMLRGYGLRCVQAVELAPDGQGRSPQEPENPADDYRGNDERDEDEEPGQAVGSATEDTPRPRHSGDSRSRRGSAGLVQGPAPPHLGIDYPPGYGAGQGVGGRVPARLDSSGHRCGNG